MQYPVPVGRALVACTRAHDWSTAPAELAGVVAGSDLSDLPDAARAHSVAGCVARSIDRIEGVDAGVRNGIQDAAREGLAGHLLARHTIATVAGALGGTPWLVVKGPVLASHVYDRPDLRTYVDLDVLVSPDRFVDALEAMEAAGWASPDRNWDGKIEEGASEIPLLSPGHMPVDLHWNLLNHASWRQEFRLDTDELVARAREIDLGGTTVRSLDATDLLVHLCVHGCLSGGNRLVWLKDVEQAVLHDPPDWDELVRRSKRSGLSLVVAAMLERTHRVLGLELPAGVVRELAGRSPWLGLVRTADRLRPVERSTRIFALSRIVMRATRSTGPRSVRRLAVSTSRAATGMASRRLRTPEGIRDPSNPQSPLAPRGGEAARREYLDLVQRRAI